VRSTELESGEYEEEDEEDNPAPRTLHTAPRTPHTAPRTPHPAPLHPGHPNMANATLRYQTI
jgi:hypothetical protein